MLTLEYNDKSNKQTKNSNNNNDNNNKNNNNNNNNNIVDSTQFEVGINEEGKS